MLHLHRPQAKARGVAGWVGSIDTGVAAGRLHYLVSENKRETSSRILAHGQSVAVGATGRQTVTGPNARLTPGKRYRVHYLHRLGPGQSSPETSPPFIAAAFGPGRGEVEVSILKRSQLRTAPEAVFFRASISVQGITEAASRRDYDESFHKVLYVWDFDDPGAASDKVRNVAAAHNDLNLAYGKEVAHVFSRPGRYAVTCTAYDPDGQLIGQDTETVTVEDPEETFAGERTIILDPAGTGPADRDPDAQIITDLNDAWQILKDLETPGRLLLPRNATMELDDRVWLSHFLHGVHISTWGRGARPVLIATASTDLIYFDTRPDYDLVLQGIDMRGAWDSTTETGAQHPGFRTNQENARSVLLDDCTLSGFGINVHILDEGDNRSASMFTLHNCDITNWGSYGMYCGSNADQFIALLGTAIHQHEEAMMGGGQRRRNDTNQQGPIRMSNGGHTHISVCDLFSRNGWSTVEGVPADQPCLRWSASPDEQRDARSSCSVERTAMEGGFDIVSLRDAIPGGPVYGTNFVMDKCLLVATANTQGGIAIQYTGVTIRNTIMVRPNTPAFAQGWNAWVARRIRRNDNPADTLNPGDPVEIYGNTMVNLMDDTTRDGRPLALDQDIDMFEAFSFENNVSFTPNAPGQQPEDPRLSRAPLETVGGVWRSRYRGTRYRDLGGSGAQLTMNDRFATPEGTVGDYLPLEGSPVLDSASGRVPVDDFLGRIRGEMPDRGAREREREL
jgi:hypothetical protein